MDFHTFSMLTSTNASSGSYPAQQLQILHAFIQWLQWSDESEGRHYEAGLDSRGFQELGNVKGVGL
jgi:hypothetical protein